MTDATLASSSDEGGSFQTTRLSSRSFDSRVGASAGERLPVDFGSRLGLSSTDSRSLAAWTDTRLGSVDTGRQDVFSAVYEPPGSRGGLARDALIGALLILAAAFAVLAARGRRPVVRTDAQRPAH